MSIGALIIRRLGMLVVVVLGVTVMTFLISHVVPGDPAQMIAGPQATEAQVELVRRRLELDKPLHLQYRTYISDLLKGDFGTSIVSNRPVLEEIGARAPATLELMLFALSISVALGISLGVATAVFRDSFFDHLARACAVIFISIPSFVLALAFLLVFYGQLELLPGGGRISTIIEPPNSITNFYVVDSILTGNWQALGSALKHLVLPSIALALLSAGSNMRIVRSSMLEVLSQDYIRTAISFGVRRRTVVFVHALRNALTPFVTVLGLALGNILFGSVVVETVFAWPGLGSYIVDSIFALDFPVIMGFTVVGACLFVLANLIVDISYLILDPQVRDVG